MVGRALRLGVVVGFALVGSGAGCSEQDRAGPAVAPASAMAQPPGNGVGMGEAEACQTLLRQDEATRRRLGCAGPDGGSVCPAYLRPAGGAACLVYDEGSVTACTAMIAAYTRCDDFERHRCLVTVLAEPSPDCPPASGGSGGVGGSGGGAAGAAPQAGRAGAGG